MKTTGWTTPAKLLLGLSAYLLAGPYAVAGVNDIKPSPILNLNAGVSYELIDDIRSGKVPVDAMFTLFTEEDQKHLPVRIDLRFTPLCAAAHGNRTQAVKDLIALGANVNAHCIDNRYVSNPLQLAYGHIGAQNRDTEVIRTLKAAGARVSSAWTDWDANDKAMTAYRDAESRRNAMENLKLLGSIALQVAKGAASAGSVDARSLGNLMISSARNTAAAAQDEFARRGDDPELIRVLESIRKTPLTKDVHAFFKSQDEGKGWCTGIQPQQMVVDALAAAKTTLQNMVPCRCEQAQANPEGMPAVCGIAYADAPR